MHSIGASPPKQRLLLAAREAPANDLIVADGISCRQQIRHGREPKHLVEVVAERIGAAG